MLRPDHFAGIFNRLEELEAFARVVAMERLLDIMLRLGKKEVALEAIKLFEDIHFDRGEHDIDDLRAILEQISLEDHPEVAEIHKAFMGMYLDYVIPPRTT